MHRVFTAAQRHRTRYAMKRMDCSAKVQRSVVCQGFVNARKGSCELEARCGGSSDNYGH